MNIPQFTAQASLYKTSMHYRTIGKFGQADATIYPALSIDDLVKSSTGLTYFDLLRLFNPNGFINVSPPHLYVSVRECCRDCHNSFLCADEECRRKRAQICNRICDAESIGGCSCPPGRSVCEGHCCKPGDVCTLDGCSPPDQVCNNRGGCLGTCLPDGCCDLGHVVCNNRCCVRGWSCTSEGCCAPGECCESTACPPGKFCCGGKVCCRDGTDCRLVHGTSEYGCFRRR